MKETGGPAFPAGTENVARTLTEAGINSDGMTLRDYFAAHVEREGFSFDDIEGLSVFIGRDVDKNDMTDIVKAGAEAVAKFKYINADAMIKERNK